MGKKAKSQEKVTAPGAANPHDEWQKAIQASAVSEQTEFCDYKPAVYMLKTKESTKELYQQISVNCTRANTFTVISYDTLIDKAIQLGDPKKRPKEVSATTSLGLDACEMLLKLKTERDQIIESNEGKDHDEKSLVPEIPSQLIALMLKFTILCAKEERIEKCRPRLDSSQTEKAGKGKDKPKSPKKGGKGKDDSATGEAINKDWSNLKKRGQEDDANNYLNDEPKSGPTQYIIVIDLPSSSFQDVVYHSAVHLQIPVYGILLHKNQQYNSSHHGQWPTKFTKIPCEENVKNIDFDSIAKACYDVVLSETVKFEIFKTYLKIVEVPTLEKLPECQNETVKNCLETIVGKLCSPFSLKNANINENAVNTSNSPDSVPNNSSLDALLQFGSDSSSAPTPTPGNNTQGGVIPEILGAETSIFDSTTNSAQNCAQKALYHELLENYRESTGDRNVSMPVIDLALKSLAAQSDIDQVFEKGSSCTQNLNDLVNFDCVEHLSKDALRSRLVQLDRQFSSITVRKFNGDASRLIIASNKDKNWEALLLGALTHQQFFKFVSPGLGKWFKLHEELFKSNSEMKIRQEALSRKVSAQSVASHQELGLNQEFVQKDSLKGEELQINSDTKPKTPDSKPGSAKGKKPGSRASSKMKLQEKSAKNSRPVSAAVAQEEPPKFEYSDPPIRMPEFLGTGLEFEKRAGITNISSGESGFNYSQSLVGVNEHQGEFSTQIVSNGKMTISTHGFNRDSQEINSFVAKLAHGTCVAYKRGTVKEYLEMTKGVPKTEDFSKIPVETVEIAETPKTPKTPGKTVEITENTEENENEVEEPTPTLDEISFGLPNGMVGEFLTTHSGLSVRFSWTNSEKVSDKVCDSVHPSNEIKSRLVTSDGVIVDTLWNGEENIIQNGKGERWHANKIEGDDSSELTSLVEPEFLSYEANDPSTDEKYVQRDDGVKLVSRPDGSVICHHKDGTRITKFDTLTRVEHPAYGSILFANGGIAITLVTGARIMSNEKGDAYQINDPVTTDFIRLENGQWTLNDSEPMFKESTENDVYICVKDDGSALEFTDGRSVYEYAMKKKCGIKEQNFGGIEGCGDLRAITLLDKVEEVDVNQGVWKSGYNYQEDTIIPAGLRISQIGGGSHALVQDDPVLQLQNRFKIPKKFIARRFTNYKKVDLENFKDSIKKLEESNLPKQIIYTDRTATIEQTELINTVLGGEGERGLNSPDVIPQQISITPNEAENLYQEAQRPISSKSSASSLKPTESVQKRLLDYQEEIQKFRCDIVALQNKNVPKYFDSELGKSWLETKDVLEELAKEVPSN